jgi:succinyl-CoA synthetase beta subunit
MKLLEYEAKEYFKKYGIPVPEGRMVEDSDHVHEYVKSLGKPVVLKVQVPVGGRGKAGGVEFAETPSKAASIAKKLLGMSIKGIKVNKLYVEEKINIINELYLGITIDRSKKKYVILVSSEGGTEIEEVASKTPDKVHRLYVDPLVGLRDYHANYLASKLGFKEEMMMLLGSLLIKLYNLAIEMDAELTEINPLAEVEDGFIATDARLNVDNNALFRHQELKERLLYSNQEEELTKREMEAQSLGLKYVELDGDIGIVGNGAGLTMATIDSIMIYGGKAANFLDLGGGVAFESIKKAIKFVLSDERVKVLFVNIVGGITRGDYIAEGIVKVLEEGVKKPIVVRMIGTREEEGKNILKEQGIEALDSMEAAADLAVKLAIGRNL